MSAFANAIAAALGTVAAVAGETVTYAHGSDTTSEITGVPGSARRDTNDVNEIPISADSRDWIFEASDLVIGGVAITPRRGDQVRQTTAGGTVTVFEVGHDGDQVYRYVDRARTRVRVHTAQRPG